MVRKRHRVDAINVKPHRLQRESGCLIADEAVHNVALDGQDTGKALTSTHETNRLETRRITIAKQSLNSDKETGRAPYHGSDLQQIRYIANHLDEDEEAPTT